MDKSRAHEALLQYQQADEEGIMVLVSRQAIHEVSEEINRLSDGVGAIRQYGSDTLGGPSNKSDDTRDWQREAVLEMTNRAARLLRGNQWHEKIET